MLESLKLKEPAFCEKIAACFPPSPASHVERGHKLLSLMKLLDSVPESAGKKNYFPWNPVDQGWAWDASTACAPPLLLGGGDQRAVCWSWEHRPDLPLSKLRRSLQTPLIPVPFTGALLLRMALHFPFPDLCFSGPVLESFPVPWGLRKYFFFLA